ncbi:hypothetical protein I3760_12G086000 [Carya illinoinensis]|uniref:Uncharacterized protein n=1 Tax=Carya illinoinensis TaxID=32201 RepID=A0A922IVX6_CARIL|nr:uncharacterized protein LOC122289644 isoform X2 [Carya illinoinensis]KAG2677157.1 hypothetical protein I3760_12G086000 [Carya illinoinensis]KAG6684921.1 hypothetical protein I3842_12G087400 [Carya illinoinensis]
MDALELPFPMDVAVPKLMGSDGFVRAGVTVKEAEAREQGGVPVLVSPPIARCSSVLRKKESACCDKVPDTEMCTLSSQLPTFQGEDVSEHIYGMGKNRRLQNPRSDSVQLQRKAAKASRSGGACSKRPRLAQMDDSMSLAGVEDKIDITDKLGPFPTRRISPENTPLLTQKNNFNKRSDKRGLKVPAKIKYDSFSMKAGLSNFSSASGGNNFFGLYGLKLDTNDITKLVDELALNDLLDGTYKCSSLVKDKGKKAENMSEDILHSVRKAFSVLQLSRPVQSQDIADVDSFSNKKISTCILSSVSGNKGESCTPDLSSCNKDSYSKPDMLANPLDLPLYQPKDILKNLVLAEPKDLESVLLDAAKSSLRNTSDIRPGKQMSRRVSLPPFPWSHTFSGHCRNNSDAIKSATTRSTCQGRWVMIGNVSSFPRTTTDFLASIESLTYDQSLVPPGLSSENKISPLTSVRLPWSDRDSLSSATYLKASHIFRDPGGQVNYQGNGQCPRLIAAAQTLYDIANHSVKQNPDGMIRWPKKPPQKAMRARKLKSNGKHEEIFATSIPLFASNNLVRNVDPLMSSKKPKLSMIESSKDLDHSNCLRKGPLSWSTLRSSRSSPGKSTKDTIAETKHSTVSILKQSCTMPPPTRVLDKDCNSLQKVRKLLPMDWNRGRDGLE